MTLPLAILLACTVTDGDTLRCDGEAVRLLGMDAPELHGCPRGRHCAPGDGEASRQAMQRAIGRGRLTIERISLDRYGRTLAVVYAQGINLSCTLIASGHAIYRRDWDNGGRIARDCPAVAQ
jgi:endonuclease YncB( thermonuclease family)